MAIINTSTVGVEDCFISQEGKEEGKAFFMFIGGASDNGGNITWGWNMPLESTGKGSTSDARADTKSFLGEFLLVYHSGKETIKMIHVQKMDNNSNIANKN